jgi:hypothetical protein
MRPRKKVLLYCHDEAQRSVFSFVLDNRGYRVIGGLEKHEDVAVAVIVDDAIESETFAGLAADWLPDTHLLVIIRQQVREGRDYPPCAAFMDHRSSMGDLLERVRILTSRKRGPKQGTVPAQEAVTA